MALIEDVAHAPQATLAGKSLGSFGLASAFSFFSNKVLPLGEGGMLVTDDDRVAAEARSLRSHGMTPVTATDEGHSNGYDVGTAGFNYRLDDARSALALSRLRRLDEEIATRRAITFRYRSLLRSVTGIEVPYSDDARGAVVVLRDGDLREARPEGRDEFRRRLLEKHGIQTTVLYPAIHEFTAYRGRYRDGQACDDRTRRSLGRDAADVRASHRGAAGSDRRRGRGGARVTSTKCRSCTSRSRTTRSRHTSTACAAAG